MHQWRVAFSFRKMIEVVRVLAQVDESSIAGTVRRIRPRHNNDRIVCGTFCGPFREHELLSYKALRFGSTNLYAATLSAIRLPISEGNVIQKKQVEEWNNYEQAQNRRKSSFSQNLPDKGQSTKERKKAQ